MTPSCSKLEHNIIDKFLQKKKKKSDLDLIKISKDLKMELIYLSLLIIENHCL
jgi:hypothetical protein